MDYNKPIGKTLSMDWEDYYGLIWHFELYDNDKVSKEEVINYLDQEGILYEIQEDGTFIVKLGG